MAKKKINTQKAVASTLCWTTIYFTLILYYLHKATGINLLNVSEWKYKYDGFVAGQWSMSGAQTLWVLSAVILFIPVWIFGSVVLYKINWSLPKFTKIREKNFKNKLVLKQQDTNGTRLKMPIKLKVQSSGLATFAAQNQPMQTTDRPLPSSDSILSTVEKDVAGIENIADEILQIANRYQVEGFLNLNLDGIQVPLALSTEDETALLMTVINEPDSFLTADISDDIGADWFSTLGPIPSPVKSILQASEKLKNIESEADIIPIIVLAGGELSDCQTVTKILNQNGIILTRFAQGKPENLETIEELLDKILKKKSDTDINEDTFLSQETTSDL
ncbi:MAG: hypothetical protein J6V11_01210 [Alphaproteobacteria bacterium]|nr:hypothetical protein [Alphaproteobacteria bacterium]